MIRLAPAARAAAIRLRGPSRRSRLVLASCCSYLRGSIPGGMSVNSWITASGLAAITAARSESASSASQSTASAPCARRRSARSAERVMPVGSWPASTSLGTSARPITPVAPATKTLIGPKIAVCRGTWSAAMRLQPATDAFVLDDDLIIAGDNLAPLSELPDGAFDLAYVDPPFNTGRAQARRTLSVAADGEGDRTGFGGRRYKTRLLRTLSYEDEFSAY